MFKWLYKDTPRYFKEWTGWQSIRDGYVSMRKLATNNGDGIIARHRKLMGDNLEQIDAAREMAFERLLAQWGIHNENDLQNAILAKRRFRLAGILVTAISAGAFIWQAFSTPQSVLLVGIHGFSLLSILACGIVIWGTSQWRLRVFKHRRFIPFLEWVKKFGRSPW
ncbi:MAG: hypothetical protein LBB60_01180 [Desulfovibrio sp.]|jgi:hypothetical protein|nr:hypothetical protein [Desulfovibrio sp.]